MEVRCSDCGFVWIK